MVVSLIVDSRNTVGLSACKPSLRPMLETTSTHRTPDNDGVIRRVIFKINDTTVHILRSHASKGSFEQFSI